MIREHQIEVPGNITPYPSKSTLSVAALLADHLHRQVIFVKTAPTRKVPSLKITGQHLGQFTVDPSAPAKSATKPYSDAPKPQIWELITPTGNGKRTIKNALRRASQKSSYLVLDLSRCPVHASRALFQARTEIRRANNIKRLILIQKSHKILVLK